MSDHWDIPVVAYWLILLALCVGFWLAIARVIEVGRMTCTGCQRHFVKVGCPVHDPQGRKP